MAEIDSALNENTIAQYIQDYRDTEITYDKLHFLESDSISDDKIETLNVAGINNLSVD